jgi:hypothetical protein
MHFSDINLNVNKFFTFIIIIIIIIWFVRLLALRPPWPIVPASGDNEDDCGEADGM